VFPLKDNIPTDRVPVVTLALIAVNAIVFLLFHGAGVAADYGLTPHALTHGGSGDGPPPALTVLTSMFVHGGVLHLLGNLLFLWIFGPNVEDSMGRGRFLAFYLLGGAAAAGVQVLADPGSTVPLIGASGAISAVMGGYLLLYPWARVLTAVFFVLFFTLVEVPALVMLAVWIGLQVLFGVAHLGDPANAGGTAYLAHVGGFAFGLLAVRLFARNVKTPEMLVRRARGRAAW
jgi:membrane associated rhomboid family serine protease